MIRTQRNLETGKSLSLKEIAGLVGGQIVGDPSVTITGVAGIKESKRGDITFISNAKYLPFLDESEASAVITGPDVHSAKKNLIRTANPSLAFTKVIAHFIPSRAPKAPGVHPTAVVAQGVRLGKDVTIGPHVVIEEGVFVGDRCVIEAGTFVGQGTSIDADSHFYPNVTLREDTQIGKRVIVHSGAVIGADGYGYETINGEHEKIPQTGHVVIEDDVEIGANVCVDRGRFQATRIGKGVKIDNLVQIAHNVTIGAHSMLVAQSGISGSTQLGERVIVAGQAGLIGHLTIGDGVIIGAGAGVIKSVPPNTVILGSPARPISQHKRIVVLTARLPELFADLAALKKQVEKK